MNLKGIQKTTIFSVILGLFLTGCYSYNPLPKGISSNKYTGLNSKERRELPTNCNALSLETAKQIAKKNNPNYLATRHSMAAAAARFHQSIGAYLPTVTANYNMYEYYQSPNSRGGAGNKTYPRNITKNSGITASWLVFDGLIRTMNMLAAKYEKRQSEALNKDALRLLMQSVRIAYNNIILAKDKIRIAKADELFNRQLYEETKIKYEAGAVPLTDLLNFEIKMHSASSEVIAQEYTFYTARSVLAELMGLTNAILPEDIFPKLEPNKEQFSVDVNVYLDTALQNRPDLRSFRDAMLASKYRVAARWGAFMPTLYAQVNWGHERNDTGMKGRWHFSQRGMDQSFNYGFDAEWVLFNGGRRIFELREAQANLAVSKQNLAEQWISVVAEVRQTYADRVRRAKQMAIYEKNLTLVKKTRDLVEEEYKAGNASITRLNEAQRDLIIADTNLATSIVDLENAKANLDAAVGMLE